ncbi:MAG: hypothetical protein IAI49_15785, partial [Candidatus Eremiobacteraeota bacterium]|nr:hypothetical protein [Candidatus Eremiobacteraeota bacterium]
LRESGELAAKRHGAFAHRVRALVLGDLGRRIEARIDALGNGSATGDPYRAAEAIVAPLAVALPRSDDVRRTPILARPTVKGL